MQRVARSWKSPLEFSMPTGEFISNGEGRRYMKVETVAGRTEAFSMFGLTTLLQEPRFTNFIGNHFLDGAYTHTHNDPTMPGFAHVRVNWMLKKPPVGGDPHFGGVIFKVNEGDVWICFASEEQHGSTPISGGERLICSFGALVPRDQALRVMEQVQ